MSDGAETISTTDIADVADVAAELRLRLGSTAERAREFAERARATSTRRAYRHDWRQFVAWCDGHGLPALPASPETVALYLAAMASQPLETRPKVATLARRLAAIGRAHRDAGEESPLHRAPADIVWRGIRRQLGVAPVGKAPLLTADVRLMIERLPDGLAGARDRALLVIGFAGAFRRSELVALDISDVRVASAGLTIALRRSKTDQEGHGRLVGLPRGRLALTCPVRAYHDWLAISGLSRGAVFRPVTRYDTLRPTRLTDQSVALIVKRAALAAGLEPAHYAGHSLRAGLATAAAQAGVDERSIMAQTGHQSVMMVRRYIRDGNLFRDNAAGSVGL
jgi:site-specific recombinase XerD